MRFLLLAMVLLMGQAMARDQKALEAWRAELSGVRALADNDANAAFREAQRLLRELPPGSEPQDWVGAMNVQTRAEAYLGLTEVAAEHAQAALVVAEDHGDIEGQAQAHVNIALISINQGNIGPMMNSSARAVELLGKGGPPDLMVEALVRQSMAQLRRRNTDESVTLCLQATDIAQHGASPLGFVYAHHCMAVANDQGGRVEESLAQYRHMRDRAREGNSRLWEGIALIGEASLMARQPDGGEGGPTVREGLVREALGLFLAVGAAFPQAQANLVLAEELQQRGEPLAALAYANQGLEIYRTGQNRLGSWWAWRKRSELHEALGLLTAARSDAQRGLALAGEIGLGEYLRMSHLRLAAVQGAMGDYRQAYRSQQEAERLATAQVRENTASRIVELAERYQNNRRQHRIDELNLLSERQIARQRWLWSALALSLVLLVLSAYFIIYQRQSTRIQQELNTRLADKRDMLRALAARRETAREEERSRIARELHDELGQRLTALRLKINLLATGMGDRMPEIGELLSMLDNTIRIVRNVSSLLRPAVLDLGIVSALEWLAGEFMRNTGIPCRLDLPAADVPLDAARAIALFRIAQESLTNVVRYAQAGEVNIAFDTVEGFHILEIRDDGVGFAPGQKPRPDSFGLIGIRERALAAGGDVAIVSAPGCGVMVRVSLPVDDKKEEKS